MVGLLFGVDVVLIARFLAFAYDGEGLLEYLRLSTFFTSSGLMLCSRLSSSTASIVVCECTSALYFLMEVRVTAWKIVLSTTLAWLFLRRIP